MSPPRPATATAASTATTAITAAATRPRSLDDRLRSALATGALSTLASAAPVDRRDRFLTLLQIHDLHTAPLEVVGDAARHQGHPVVAELKLRLESDWLAELDLAWATAGRLDEATTPERAVTAMRSVAARDRLPDPR